MLAQTKGLSRPISFYYWSKEKLKGQPCEVNTKPFLMLFEQSWESEEVPGDWKLVTVIQIFKKGQKEDPRNYRPVCRSSVPCKVMEKIILEDPSGQNDQGTAG
ncbi:hypothetical protein BTVI_16224 [Pitangus sulphuratus]|nr:hypothetical protein BTVI_16224 [Pitangus sulphuratus]